jgi:hypothetical protein
MKPFSGFWFPLAMGVAGLLALLGSLLPTSDRRLFEAGITPIPPAAMTIVDDRFADQAAPHLVGRTGPLIFAKRDLRAMAFSDRAELPGKGSLFLLTDKPDDLPAFLRGAKILKKEKVREGFTLFRVELARPQSELSVLPLAGLLSSARARVFDQSGEEKGGCAFSRGRCRYGERAWETIKVSTERFSKKGQACLFLHPLENGRVHVEIPGLPRGSAFKLGYGLNDSANADPPHLLLRAQLDDVEVLRVSPAKRGHWAEKTVEGNPEKKTLRIDVEATEISKRFLCVNPQVIRRIGQK